MGRAVLRVKLKDGAIPLLGEREIARAQRGVGLLQEGMNLRGGSRLRKQWDAAQQAEQNGAFSKETERHD